jgi:hypothetical protein
MQPTAEPESFDLRSLAAQGHRRLLLHDTSVMNECGYYRSHLAAQHYFPERALWLAAPDDLVVLASPIEPAYWDFLHEQRLCPTRTPLAPVPFSDVCRAGGVTHRLIAKPDWHAKLRSWVHESPRAFALGTFCPNASAALLSRQLCRAFPQAMAMSGDAQAVENVNRKVFTRHGLAGRGIAQIPGVVVDGGEGSHQHTLRPLWRAASSLFPESGRVMIRANYASGGAGNFVAEPTDRETLADWLAQMADADQFLVERFLPSLNSPNIQYWIEEDGTSRHVQTTDQRFEALISHSGNRFPATVSATEVEHASAPIVAWLVEEGVRGLIGIDYLQWCDDRGKTRLQFVEVNARFNGSSYPTAMWQQINRIRAEDGLPELSHWQSLKGVRTRLASFAALSKRVDDLLYRPGSARGLVPYWTGALRHGVCSCLFLGDSFTGLDELEAEFLDRVTGDV